MRYKVTKVVEFTWPEVEADDADAALTAAEQSGNPDLRVVRQKARDLDRAHRTPAEGAITDRELRPGRRFVARYKDKTYEATVQPDHTIKVPGTGEGYKSLSTVGSLITGHRVNGWVFFKDAPTEEPTRRKTTSTRKRTKQARPPTPRPATARARAQGMRVHPPVEPIVERNADEHEANLRAQAEQEAVNS